MARQPENFLYNNNTYQLPAPASVLAASSQGGLAAPGGNGMNGLAIGSSGPGEVKSPREWLLFVIWRQKWLIAATIILCGLAAVAYLTFATPMYTSTARLYVQQLSTSVGPNSGAEGGLSSVNGANFLNTQKEVVTSEPVLELAATYQGVLQSNEMRDVKDPVEHLKKAVSTEIDKTTDLIDVRAFCASGEDASTIANAVVEAYKGFQTRSPTKNSSSVGETMEVLEARKADVEALINAKIQKLHEMEVTYGVLSRKDSSPIFNDLQSAASNLTAALAEDVDSKMAADEVARSFNGHVPTQPANVDIDDQDIPISTPQEMAVLRSEMLQTQTQLQELEQRYLPEHPAVMALKKRLNRLNVQYVAAVERHWLSAHKRAQDLQAAYDKLQKKAVDLDSHAAEYARLQDDLTHDKGVRDGFEARIRDIHLAREAGQISIEVLEHAKPAPRPTWPSTPKTLAVALAMGLSLGLLFACMREWIDDRFRSAGEIKSSLGMPLLAVIPQSAAKRSPSVSGQRVLLDPGSDTAEAYRSLRAAILYSAPADQLKTILITSPSSGDGKTTLVSNLAIAMAQGGRKVLIVDADLRNASQHDIFGVKNNTGLSALLAGRSSLETAIQRSHVQNLEILPCGPTPANPAEILNSREFGETLETLADRYDCVIIDSPPVEAVADARIIAASCDGTIIVLKAQTAHRRTTEHSRDSLAGVGARILGVVVNDLPKRANSYGRNNQNRRYVPGLTGQEAETSETAKAGK